MTHKKKRASPRFISLSLLGGMILSLSGCSGKEGLIPWGKFGGFEGRADLSEFFSSIRPRPGNPHSHYLLACYYQERGRHREAIGEFQKVLSIDPKYVKAYNGLGVSSDLLGEFPAAVSAYEAALSLEPEQAYLHNNLGYSYLMQGNPDRAISAFRRAASLNPREPRFHNNLATAYGEKAQFREAMEAFLRGGDEAQAHFNMAEIYFQKGIYVQAGSNYTAALRLDPSKTLARTGAKAADALASILGRTPKSQGGQEGAMIPEPPKIETKADREGNSRPPVLPENQPPPQTPFPLEAPVLQPAGRIDSEGISPRVPVIQVSGLEKEREEGKEAHPKGGSNDSTKSPKSADPSSMGGSGEWNFEMKMAVLQGEAIPMEAAAAKSATKAAVPKKEEMRRDVGIEVSNGNGVRQMAKRVGLYLQAKGYPVSRLTNSKSFTHGQTRIYYREGNGEIALRVANQLPIYYDLIELKKLDRPSIQVRIVLGQDIIPHDKKFSDPEGS